MDPLNIIEETYVCTFNTSVQSTSVSRSSNIQQDPMDPFNLPYSESFH